MKSQKRVDGVLLVIIVLLTVIGFTIFSSASLGLLAKAGDKYGNVAFSQTFFGLFCGTLAALVLSRFEIKQFRNFAFLIGLISVIVTLLVWVPGLGFSHGGATRWIRIGGFTLQTSEFLKIGMIIYAAAWFSSVKDSIKTLQLGLLPLFLMISLVGTLLLTQPDSDTFLVISSSIVAMYFVAGGSKKHFLVLLALGILGASLLIATRPYVRDRVMTFINPDAHGQTKSYQVQQSLIAIGSGGMIGRGFGQSLQKFTFLPEPIGDSIFAVAGEEFGFVGAVLLVLLFVAFALRGLKVANATNDNFARLLIVGIVILITAQAFINMMAMIGALPMMGITLPFVSHGGTALLMTLAQAGILLSASRLMKKT